jgi:hypothetical protein
LSPVASQPSPTPAQAQQITPTVAQPLDKWIIPPFLEDMTDGALRGIGLRLLPRPRRATRRLVPRSGSAPKPGSVFDAPAAADALSLPAARVRSPWVMVIFPCRRCAELPRDRGIAAIIHRSGPEAIRQGRARPARRLAWRRIGGRLLLRMRAGGFLAVASWSPAAASRGREPKRRRPGGRTPPAIAGFAGVRDCIVQVSLIVILEMRHVNLCYI